MRYLFCILIFLAGILPVFAGNTVSGGSQSFSAMDLVTMKRLYDPQLSPDGKLIVFVLRETDMKADRGRTDLWLV